MIGRDEKTVPQYQERFDWTQARKAILKADLYATVEALAKIYPAMDRGALTGTAERLIAGARKGQG